MPDTPSSRKLLDSHAAYVAAADELLAQARQLIRIFDPDLAQLALSAPARIALLESFFRHAPGARLQVVVRDVRHLTRQGARLLTLQRRFPRALSLLSVDERERGAEDCFVLVDTCHFVRRPVAAQSRGVLALHARREATQLGVRFEELLGASQPAAFAGAPGLSG